jgi:hypothetical protein
VKASECGLAKRRREETTLGWGEREKTSRRSPARARVCRNSPINNMVYCTHITQDGHQRLCAAADLVPDLYIAGHPHSYSILTWREESYRWESVFMVSPEGPPPAPLCGG